MRGFTLLEVIMAAGLIAVIALMVSQMMISQQRLFSDNEDVRSMDENLRLAAATLNRSISNAGFGLDPNLAVDFQYYDCSLADSYTNPVLSTSCPGSSHTAGAALPRNRTDGPDELVVYSRDPNYYVALDNSGTMRGNVWKTTAWSSPNLTLSSNVTLGKGQILRLSCAPSDYTYVTVAATANNTNRVQLTIPSSANDAFQQTSALSDPCFASGAYVHLIKRERYFIAPFNNRPYLMLDTGTDLNLDGKIDNNDIIPIAADIEDMQVGYAINQDPNGVVAAPDLTAGNGNFLIYDTSGESGIQILDAARTNKCDASGSAVSFYQARCMTEPSNYDPIRYNLNPANITAIRVSLVGRTTRFDSELYKQKKETIVPALLDRAAVDLTSTSYPTTYSTVTQGSYGYRRSIVSLAPLTPNLGSRGYYDW